MGYARINLGIIINVQLAHKYVCIYVCIYASGDPALSTQCLKLAAHSSQISVVASSA